MFRTIRIPGAYQVRAELTARGYRWDPDGKCWYRNAKDQEQEEKWLRSLGCIPEYRIGNEKILLKHYFVITGNTFGLKDDLKRFGYFARKEAGEWVWRKEIEDYEDKVNLAVLLEREKERIAGFKEISLTVI